MHHLRQIKKLNISTIKKKSSKVSGVAVVSAFAMKVIKNIVDFSDSVQSFYTDNFFIKQICLLEKNYIIIKLFVV